MQYYFQQHGINYCVMFLYNVQYFHRHVQYYFHFSLLLLSCTVTSNIMCYLYIHAIELLNSSANITLHVNLPLFLLNFLLNVSYVYWYSIKHFLYANYSLGIYCHTSFINCCYLYIVIVILELSGTKISFGIKKSFISSHLEILTDHLCM